MEEKIEKTFLEPSKLPAEELNKMLKSGVVNFLYRKKPKKGQPEGSGEIREAWGTKEMGIVTKIPSGGDCPPKRVGYTTYFDLEKDDWRVFNEDRLIGVNPKVYTKAEFDKLKSI